MNFYFIYMKHVILESLCNSPYYRFSSVFAKFLTINLHDEKKPIVVVELSERRAKVMDARSETICHFQYLLAHVLQKPLAIIFHLRIICKIYTHCWMNERMDGRMMIAFYFLCMCPFQLCWSIFSTHA